MLKEKNKSKFKYANILKSNFIKRFFRIFPILVFLSILLYVSIFGDFKSILKNFENLNYKEVFFIFFLIMFKPLLDTLRWHEVFKLYYKSFFFKLHRATIVGYTINSLGFTNAGVEASKFVVMRETAGSKKSFIILIIERLISGIIKAQILLFAALIFFYNYQNFYIYLLIFFLCLFAILILLNYLIKFLFVRKIKRFMATFLICFKKVKIHFFRLFFIGLIAQVYNIFIYCLIIIACEAQINLIEVFFIVPIIELSVQIASFIPSMNDISSIFMFSLTNLTFETAIFVAMFFKIGEIISIVMNTFIIEYYEKIQKI